MGVFIMRNFIGNLFRFSTISLAIVGFFAPLSSAHASNLLVNGDFNGSSGWTVSQNGGSGVLFNGALQFSYQTGEVFQAITVTPGDTVTLSFAVDNSLTNSVGQGVVSDTWTATISSDSPSPASATVTRSVAHDLENFSLSITIPQGATTATITFSGMDKGFWSGHYGPSIDNVSIGVTPAAFVPTGYPADQQWEAVTYGDGKFVAVASSGDGNRVMTSTNGNYWTSRTSASDSNWQGITYADNQFVAVGSNAVMTSPDGVTWTSRTAPVGEWQAITNCGGLFVATATWGSSYVMSSTDGVEWTLRTPSYGWSHDAVACSATIPRFVSVSQFGRAWSSANGTTGWSTQNPGAIVDIRTVAFGNGRFSWLEYSTNSGNRYGGYSINGLNWSAGLVPSNQWKYITYGEDKFIAVAEGGLNSRSAYSTDGANWTLGSGVPNNSWQGVAYGAGKYVAVANSGTDNRVMTSADGQSWESLSVTPPPYFNAVTNLTAVANADGSVNLDWDAPTSSNVDIYAYAVSFYDLDEIGGTTSGGWGLSTNQGTTYLLSTGMFSGSNPLTTGYGPVRFGIKAGNQSCFSSAGVGPCVYGPEVTVDATVLDPTPATTTTTEPEPETTTTTEPELETTTTTEPEPETTTTTEPEPETTTTTEPEPEITTTTEPETIPPVVIPPDTDPPTVDPEPETTVPEPETTIPEPEVIEPEPETTVPEEISDQVDEILSGDLTEEEFANAVDEILTSADNEEELVAAATELLSGDLSEEQFTEVIDQVFAEELSDEAFAEVLDTVFEEPLSDEEFTAVIDAVLDQPLSDEQFENLVDVLSSETVTDEQVQEAVDAIIENGITEDQATEIATSAEVLSSIDGEQAAEIFAEIPIDDITEEQALEIITAVQDAPTEVRSSFEEEINIFGSGSLNTYVPLGSSINVGQRRAVIAAGAVIAVALVAGASRRR
jgi:hypothetical protein